MQQISTQTKQILNITQLILYIILFILSLIKTIHSLRNSLTLLLKFYISTTIITSIQITIQSLQIAYNTKDLQLNIIDFLIINIYAIVFQSLAIFLLGDYWYQTRELLIKNSNQYQLQGESHIVRYVIMGIGLIFYSIFIAYGLITNQLLIYNTYRQILILGCQGLSICLILYALTLQLFRGYTLKSSITKYKQWINSISISTLQFECLYYISTILNILRIGYLIAITVIVDIYNQEQDWLYLFSYVYTGTNMIIIVVYLFGFSMDKENIGNQTLLSGNKESLQTYGERQKEGQREDKKKRQTELSHSFSGSSYSKQN